MKMIGTVGILLFIGYASGADANLISNASFENGNFVNDGSNYDRLLSGETSLTGWMVLDTVAWGLNPTDGFSASHGSGFVDLSGFAAESPTGSLSQLVATSVGVDYLFSIDLQGTNAQVSLGGQVLSLAAGPSVGDWTTYTGLYSATSATTTLELVNVTPNSEIVFVDNVSLTAAAVPEPATAALIVTSIGILSLLRRPQARRP